jgi:hypothetical protein
MNLQVVLDVLEKRKFTYPSGIRTLDRPARSLVSVPFELSGIYLCRNTPHKFSALNINGKYWASAMNMFISAE